MYELDTQEKDTLMMMMMVAVVDNVKSVSHTHTLMDSCMTPYLFSEQYFDISTIIY